jgi:integrase
MPLIGSRKLKKLSADDVDDRLDGLTGKLSTSTMQRVHSILKRAIRQAQARDKVIRNVADLVTTPKGKAGRPSKALTLAQATAVLKAAKSSPLHAYVVLSLMTGAPTEEARALRWDHVVAWTEGAGWHPVTEAAGRFSKWPAQRIPALDFAGDPECGESGGERGRRRTFGGRPADRRVAELCSDRLV